MDSLKRKFGDKLEIFIVSREPKAKVEKMFATKPIAQGFKLPFIVEDSILNELFPKRFIPHEVILKGGKVVAITYPEFINGNTIANLLQGKAVELPVKNDIEFEKSKSFFENIPGESIDLTIREFLLTKHVDGLGSIGRFATSKDASLKRVVNINRSLLSLILNAANVWDDRNRVILNVKDSTKFFITGPSEYRWMQQNTYGIEYVVPAPWSWTKINNWVFQHLKLYLNYRIYKKDTLVNCWVLSRAGGVPVKNNDRIGPTTKKNRVFNNLKSLVGAMNAQVLTKPFVPIIINEVEDSMTQNLVVNVRDIHDPYEVAKAIKSYGLALRPVKRKLKMLVIEDRPQ